MKPLFVLVILLVLIGCQSSNLPTEYYSQYQYHRKATVKNDHLEIELANPLHAPLRIWLNSKDTTLQAMLAPMNPVLLQGRSDTTFIFKGISNLESGVNISSLLGDPDKEIKDVDLTLPFPEAHTYRIIQGNNTDHTHNTDWSRYAVDFDLKTNDTICAATDGYIVGLIDQYALGGKGDKWKPFSNFITLYEPKSGIYTQYVHFKQNGSLVKVGDKIFRGQPIALSGLTGQTDIEHLHFNCLVPDNSKGGLKSIPHQFIEGYQSVDLNKNDRVKK